MLILIILFFSALIKVSDWFMAHYKIFIPFLASGLGDFFGIIFYYIFMLHKELKERINVG